MRAFPAPEVQTACLLVCFYKFSALAILDQLPLYLMSQFREICSDCFSVEEAEPQWFNDLDVSDELAGSHTNQNLM